VLLNLTPITGIVIVIIGLALSAVGAFIIYKADFPRNAWLLNVATVAASRPSYGVIAPNTWSPQAERTDNLAGVEQMRQETERYATSSRIGMAWILSGFLTQVAGNTVLILPHMT
jgi:hypothetical protein